MFFLRSFINLFFVPVVSMYYFMKTDNIIKRGFENYPSWFKLLVQYCIIVAVNIPLTKVFTFAIRVIIGLDIEADSSYYTVAALVAALIMPKVYEALKNIFELIKKDKNG